MYERRLARREELERQDAGRVRRTDVLRRREYRRALDAAGLLPLARRDLLDVGCQWGSWLAWCREEWGAEGRLCGVELMPEWVEKGRRLYPFIEITQGSGDRLPFADGSFDVVHQGMVFSSVLDAGLRNGIAAEMRRVLRPRGVVVWYDFFFNPANRETVGLTLRHVRQYFPDWRVTYCRRVTLLPPLSRVLERVAPRMIDVLTGMRLLNFHYIMTLHKPG